LYQRGRIKPEHVIYASDLLPVFGHWHRHPVISVGYVLSGELTLEKRETGEHTIEHPGQALAETVQTTHRGFTTNEPVELVVFYAGQVGLPISINEE
jgi:quercetin dioxygenase-like cupin family protein